jgi:hypothetical protein
LYASLGRKRRFLEIFRIFVVAAVVRFTRNAAEGSRDLVA